MFARISLLSVFSLFLSLALAPSPASAQSFSPTNTTTTLSGFFTVANDIIYHCQAEIDVSIDANGQATVTNRSIFPGSSTCGLWIEPFGTWALSPDSTTQVTVTLGFVALGACSGDVTAIWNNANSTLTIINQIITGLNSACIVSGGLTAGPAITIVP